MVKLKDILRENETVHMDRRESEFEEFADKRGDGAKKISDSAKDKGGLSMLTHNHFRVKLPYYKKAASGKLNLDQAKEEYLVELDKLYKSTKNGMQIDQKTFQELMGRIEVLGELIIRDEND